MMDINKHWRLCRYNIKYSALILISLSVIYEVSNLDNILDSIPGKFLIIGCLDQIDDFSGEMQLVSKMKQIRTDELSPDSI